MSDLSMKAAQLMDMLPEEDKCFAYEFIKKLVLAWDPDYTKVTDAERKSIFDAENSGFVNESDIDWDDLSGFAQ